MVVLVMIIQHRMLNLGMKIMIYIKICNNSFRPWIKSISKRFSFYMHTSFYLQFRGEHVHTHDLGLSILTFTKIDFNKPDRYMLTGCNMYSQRQIKLPICLKLQAIFNLKFID